MTCETNSGELFNNSDQNFLTTVFDEQGEQISATLFSGAEYRIFDLSCTVELVNKSLGSGIVVDGDQFKTSLTESEMNMDAGQYIHQFKVINGSAQTLPPIFQEQVTINNVCEV